MTKMDRRKKPFKIGDKVVSDYCWDESNVLRTITWVKKSSKAGSGWYASADGGEPCRTCDRSFARAIREIDSDWFRLANDEEQSQ